ncbi:Adrenodoxin-like protein 1, mitochondrial [Actinomortierella ambigua]|uniref:Adrenodoxin-like protein 1, mitochondrial n=1 Tax=Actinomortierella ambigua TaxID=1343610 RepID=A0A9P6UAA5_9FUNG|nr:Adrenodoxin-like protein 1, mitochondrial [Actinomortierella ambigua]
MFFTAPALASARQALTRTSTLAHAGRRLQISRTPTTTSFSAPTTGLFRSQRNSLAPFSTTSALLHSKRKRPGPNEGFEVNFITQDGEKVTVRAHEGESLLDVAWANDLDLEGACEASLACSTCHLILDEASFDKLEEPCDEENDMLDLAFGLTDTSRLGCQVIMNKDLDGVTARMPSATRNMYVDGAKPKHH